MTETPHPTGYYERPGVTFPVNISDPKERIQAYLDAYKSRTDEDEA